MDSIKGEVSDVKAVCKHIRVYNIRLISHHNPLALYYARVTVKTNWSSYAGLAQRTGDRQNKDFLKPVVVKRLYGLSWRACKGGVSHLSIMFCFGFDSKSVSAVSYEEQKHLFGNINITGFNLALLTEPLMCSLIDMVLAYCTAIDTIETRV